MSDKCYIKYGVQHDDGYEINVTEVFKTDVPDVYMMFNTFFDFLESMTFPKYLIKKTIVEYSNMYEEDDEV